MNVNNIQFEINDANAHLFEKGDAKHCGGEQRMMGTCLPPKTAYGARSDRFEYKVPRLPRVQWPDLIADKLRRKATLFDIHQDSGQGIRNQKSFGWCHGFSAVAGAVTWAEVQGVHWSRVKMSASSVAAPAAGWANRGAAIEDDLEIMATQGICETSVFPEFTTNQRSLPADWKQNAAKHVITRWYWAKSRSLDDQVSLILQDLPGCNGLNYWGHAVLDLWVRDLNSSLDVNNDARWGIIFANSWDVTWGDNGYGLRTGSKKYADQLYSPCQTTAGN